MLGRGYLGGLKGAVTVVLIRSKQKERPRDKVC